MNNILTKSLVAMCAMAAGQYAVADSKITWVPQIGLQMKNLDFFQEIESGDEIIDSEGGLDVDMPTLTASLTAVYEKFYVSFKYEDTFDGASSDSDVPFTDSETNVERTDLSVTLGYNVWNSLNLFVGYMEGESKLTPQPICPTFPTQEAEVNCGTEGFNGNLAHEHFINDLTPYVQTYKEDGWYLGASYGWKLTKSGNFSMSLAYADLDANYKENYLGEGSGADFDFDGKSDGLSFGINWSDRLTKRLGYYADVRVQRYDMETSEASSDFDGLDVSTEETITAFSLGIQWYL